MSPNDLPVTPPVDPALVAALQEEVALLRKRTAELSASLAKYNPGLPTTIECLDMIVAVFEASADHIMVLNSEGIICGVNQSGAAEFRTTPSEMVGRPLKDFVAPLLYEKRIEWVNKALSCGRYLDFSDNYKDISYLHRLFPYADPDTGEGRVVVMTTDDSEKQKAREALNKSENLYRTILSQIEIVCRWLPDMTLTYVNDGYMKFYNLSPQELIGKKISDLLPDEGKEIFSSMAEELLVRPRQMIVENRLIDYEGNTHWIEWCNTPILNDQGAVIEFQSVGWEITARRNVEKALRQSEARYKAIVEDQDELICRYLPGGELTYVNRAYANYYKKKVEDLVGQRFLPHIPEPDIGNVLKHIYSLSKENPVTVYKNRIIHENGEISWQQWTLRAIYGDTSTEPTEYQTVGRDITKQELADQALAEQRRFLRLVIDTLPNLIFVIDRENKFVLVSKAMAELCGCTTDDMIGKRMDQIGGNAAEGAQFMRGIVEVHETGGVVITPEQYITNPKGEQRCFSSIALLMEDGTSVLGMALDITDRIKAEEERSMLERQLHKEQKLQALGTMAGGIAHDFNNMLFAIHGYIRLALKQAAGETKVSSYLLQIQHASKKASDLVRQLLVFTHQIPHVRELLHLREVLKEVEELLRPNLQESIKINIVSSTDDDAIVGDPTQINQLFMNLGTNAVQAMQETGGTLVFHLAEANDAESHDKPMLSVSVQDNGVGIDQSIAEKIFDPFFTTKSPGKGTGMGLAVVDGIVKNHGGHITVRSKVGQGSTFTVYLPKDVQNRDG